MKDRPARATRPVAGESRRLRRFQPTPTERPLGPDEAFAYFAGLYVAEPHRVNNHARRWIRTLRLAEVGWERPEELVHEALLKLRDNAADPARHRPLYRSGLGLLLRQIEFTAKKIRERWSKSGELPAGSGRGADQEGELDLLQVSLDREAWLAFCSREAGLDLGPLRARLEAVVEELREELREALRTGEIRLTAAQYRALRDCRSGRGGGDPIPDGVRAAAKRARDALWPWFMGRLKEAFADRDRIIPEGDRERRLAVFLEAVGFFEERFLEGIVLPEGPGARHEERAAG